MDIAVVGSTVGILGCDDGIKVGLLDGETEGSSVGETLGCDEGRFDGRE